MSSSYDRYKAFFEEADADGSGQLTLDELTAALRRRGYTDSDTKIRASIKTRKPTDSPTIHRLVGAFAKLYDICPIATVVLEINK